MSGCWRCDAREMTYLHHTGSPLGSITLAGDGEALTGLWFDGQKHFGAGLPANCAENMLPVFAETERWLQAYFAGENPDFTPPLAPQGTAFQKAVWDILLTIPYGETTSYGAIAARLAKTRGLPHFSAQAVGGAVGRNPISLLIPCHRVVAADGSLTGYAGGLEKKRFLLRLEAGAR